MLSELVRDGRVRLGRGRPRIQGERSTEPGQHHVAGVSSSGVDRERIGGREWLAFLDDELDALRDQPGCQVAARLATSTVGAAAGFPLRRGGSPGRRPSS
jgi:hypothetical protein